MIGAMPPAARVGDMHTCPMQTPGTPPIPHVGGPILPPGQPTVLIGPRAAQNMIPPQAVDISIAFFIMIAVMVVGWPIARAFGRRIERRGQVATLDAGTMEQLQRIEQAVDAMAIEVERISEAQRYFAKLHSAPLSEPAALDSGERR